jgi:hypothetical protein
MDAGESGDVITARCQVTTTTVGPQKDAPNPPARNTGVHQPKKIGLGLLHSGFDVTGRRAQHCHR